MNYIFTVEGLKSGNFIDIYTYTNSGKICTPSSGFGLKLSKGGVPRTVEFTVLNKDNL